MELNLTLMYSIYMGLQIKKGIKDYEEGQTMTLEEVRNLIDNC